MRAKSVPSSKARAHSAYVNNHFEIRKKNPPRIIITHICILIVLCVCVFFFMCIYASTLHHTHTSMLFFSFGANSGGPVEYWWIGRRRCQCRTQMNRTDRQRRRWCYVYLLLCVALELILVYECFEHANAHNMKPIFFLVSEMRGE